MEIPEIILFACLILFNIILIFFKLFPPKQINSLYGYRTNSSMKSEVSWHFANKYFSNLIFQLNLILSTIILIFYFIMTKIEFILLIELLGFVLILLFSIIVTEIKLKKVNNV
jgi:uncharacterized membrane protein